MLIEKKEDRGDKVDYRRNLIAKPDHGLEQPQDLHYKGSDMPYKGREITGLQL